MKKAGKGGGATGRQASATVSRAERRRAGRAGSHLPMSLATPTGWRAILAAKAQTTSFRVAAGLFLLGPVFLLVSQSLPHDYGFLELGGLFTLSIYDLVLAIVGLSVGSAMAESTAEYRSIWGIFAGVLLVVLLFFDPIFYAIRETALGTTLYLVAPISVAFSGVTLWLPHRLRRHALVLAAALTAFSLSLFIGLDDLGVGIADFAWGAGFCALWLLISPGLLLRQFGGDWLRIPSRIVGSWLLVIAVIVTVSLYVPMPVVAPPPPTTGLQSGPYQGNLPATGEGGEE